MSDDVVSGLITRLRGAGLTIPVGNLVDFVTAIDILGTDLRSLHRAGRATLAKSPIEIELFDHVFRQWILGTPSESGVAMSKNVTRTLSDADECDDEASFGTSESETSEIGVLRFSSAESLRDRDFADLDEAERAESDRLIAEMRLSSTHRRSRRRRASTRVTGELDVRRTVRESLRNGGEPIRLRATQRSMTARRIVILADISGSMSDYSRSLLRFAHAAIAARRNVEAFALGTRLTRLTRELTTRDPDGALTRAAASVEDWSGGTRLGEGLRYFNDEWGMKGMARGAIVVILSDGWDRGDVEVLAAEMGRLSRVAHRIVWVNPLKASDGYAPLARGMAAALPFVDDFVEGHSLHALEELSAIISSDRPRPVRSVSEVNR